MARIVIVSNRVPVPKQSGKAGGLAVVLKDAINPGDMWFGWSGRTAAESSAEARIAVHDGVSFATVDLSESDYRSFYVGFANGTLWPLLHFRLGLMEFRRENLEGYRAVNESFALALMKLLRPDDLVWVHDYHLIPLAAMLRKLGATNRMGFFLHIPFVPSSVFASLPQGRALLEDFCAYDAVGFQTKEHHQDFLDCVRRILRVPAREDGAILTKERITRSVVSPVGIDGDAFRRQAERSLRTANAKRLIDSLNGRPLLIGADRLDYSKGLVNRLEAYHRLLARFPEHKQKVSYLQIASPSREDVRQYADLRPQINRMTGDINARHGSFDWVPLRYMSQDVARSTLAGFFRIARVGVVTPLRDGMNLVAHEFVAAQDPADPGVLILSQFAGVASYFTDALIVNPHDPDEIAEAMHEALSMSQEMRIRRHQGMLAQLANLTTRSYCETFMKTLVGAEG